MTERTVLIAAIIAVVLGVIVALSYRPGTPVASSEAPAVQSSAAPVSEASQTQASKSPAPQAGVNGPMPEATIKTAAEFEAMWVKDPTMSIRSIKGPGFTEEFKEKVQIILPLTPQQEAALENGHRHFVQQWQATVASSGMSPDLPMQDRRRVLNDARRQIVQQSEAFLEGMRHQFSNEAQFEMLRQFQQSEYKNHLREFRARNGLNE